MSVLLKAAVGEAAEVVGESSDHEDSVVPKFNPVQFENRVLERAREVAAEGQNTLFEFRTNPREANPQDAGRISELESYPDDSPETRKALSVLKDLSPWAVQVLAEFGKDEVSSLEAEIEPGLRKNRRAPITWELVSQGLVEYTEDGSESLVRLTDWGRAVARLVVPMKRPPDWIIAELNTSPDGPGP